ncbi:MAG: dihydrofolate reductase family protein, partial [Euryarchaeota archaeon]|nr:dihydrofolate reductase family protein [Euryarchaeota archaeon]
MKRPYVILNAAMSLDGKIATRTGEARISTEADWIRVHKLR